MPSKEYNPTTIDDEVKKNLKTGYYNRFTGKQYNSKSKRDRSEREWKAQYRRDNRQDFPGNKGVNDMPASYWQKHAKYSTRYGRGGSGYNIETARVDYRSDWVGPDTPDKAWANPNFKKVWTALTLGKRGGISDREYPHLKNFLVRIKQGGTDLANMKPAEANKIIGVINDFKAQAEKMGKDYKWTPNSYKSSFINDVAKALAKTDKYKWLDTKVPTVITKDGDKFFDYQDKFNRGLADLDPDTAKEFESKYIDEVYGTTKGEVGTEGQGALQTGKTTSRWGLDLVRVDANFTVGSQKQYEHLTRGKVNWAHYRTDKWFNKAAAHLDIKAGDITAKGNEETQIQDIRKTNALLNRTSKPSETEWGKWTKTDWKYEVTGIQYSLDDNGVMWGTDPETGAKERQVSFNELMDPKSKFYLKPGQTKTFGKDGELGVTKDGVNITREYKSPVADMDKWVYEVPKDDHKDHETPSGFKVEGKVKKQVEDIKRPNITGIKWDGNTPKLTSPVKMFTPPTITPLIDKGWKSKKADTKTTTTKTTTATTKK